MTSLRLFICRAGIIIAVLASPSAATSALQQAITTLALGPHPPIPEGTTVRLGKTSDGNMAETSSDGLLITINPDAIEAMLPGLSDDAANLPGVLYGVLAHETYHANEARGNPVQAPGGQPPPYNTVPRGCGDVKLDQALAVDMCDLITSIDAIGSNPCNLCKLYDQIRNCYNNACAVPGGASAYNAQHCGSNPYPGDIPECSACESCY